MSDQVMTYQTLAHFSETWGLLFLMVLFAAAVAWALWPSNRERFEEAALIPLQDDQEDSQ